MKKLILLNENTDIKLNDTGTIIQFKAQNDGQPVSISNGQTATFRIKNDFGFVKSVKASSSYGGYVFELDTADLNGLVVGSYQVELLIQKDADDALIFPDTAFVGFNITANALTITGEQLPMMSLDEFKDELKTYVDDQTASAETTIKNDFQSYVDDLRDSTIATANKASQDAQTAITTANGAVNTANTAKSTADTASSKANANASLISTLNDAVNIYANTNLYNHWPDSNFDATDTTWNNIGGSGLSVEKINQGYGFDNSLKVSVSGVSSLKYWGVKVKNMIPVQPGTVISVGALVSASDLDNNAKLEFGMWNEDKSSRISNPGILITNNNGFSLFKYENYTVPSDAHYIEIYPFVYKNGTIEITHPVMVQGSHLPNIWMP